MPAGQVRPIGKRRSKIGIDVRKVDQHVRGTVSLPHGTGKNIILVVIARGEKVNEAKKAGADFAGADDFSKKSKGAGPISMR